MNILHLRVDPEADPEITCFMCWKPNVTHSFVFRMEGRTSTVGVHLTCAIAQEEGKQAPHPMLVTPKCTCSYDDSEEMTSHAPLCAITRRRAKERP